jgi:hypothetical protein
MKQISPTGIKYAACFFLLFAAYGRSDCQQNRLVKVQQLYDSLKSYQIDNPETVLATAIFETGWMECTDCSLNMNNLFGFRLDNGYVQFSNYSECFTYMKKWQNAFYAPWKAKHPTSSYYDFMTYVNYAQNMPVYIQTVKALEQWIFRNVETNKADLTKSLFKDPTITGFNF